MKNRTLFVKGILLPLLLLNLMVCFVSCGKDSDMNEDMSEEKAMDIVNNLIESDIFESELNQVEKNIVVNSYRISDKNIEVICGYMGDGASAEEIVVLKGSKGDVKELTEEYIKNKGNSYRDYLPVEADKVDNAIIKQSGSITIVCICKDKKSAENIINSN